MIFLVPETCLFYAGVHFKASHEMFATNNEWHTFTEEKHLQLMKLRYVSF